MSLAPSFCFYLYRPALPNLFHGLQCRCCLCQPCAHFSDAVVLLPKYVNCSTLSKCLPSINNFPVGSFSPNTIVFVFSKFMLSPYLLPSSFSARVVSSSLRASSSIRSISSANARLLILVPFIFTPPSLSLILSSILSNTSMKVFGDIGSPCLVPLLVAT